MNPNDLYQILNLPVPPADLVHECRQAVREAFVTDHTGQIINNSDPKVKWHTLNQRRENWVKNNLGESNAQTWVTLWPAVRAHSAVFKQLAVSTSLSKWIETYIKPVSNPINPPGIQVFHPRKQDALPMSFPAHVDGPRGRRVLNFHIDTGGPAAETVWFQQPGHSICRYRPDEKNTYTSGPMLDFLPSQIWDLSGLHELACAGFQAESWTAIDVKTLHSVRNLSAWRSAISIGIRDDEVDEFCRFHNIDPASGQLWQKLK